MAEACKTGETDIVIRISGKEILKRLISLESNVKRLNYATYIQTAVLLSMLAKLILF